MGRHNPRLPVDQLEKYWTSDHGKKLKQGETDVATCVSCHGSHDILAPSDPRSSVYKQNVPATCAHCHANPEIMSKHGIPTNQYAEYARSVHGVALLDKGDTAAAACNDCHGNHGAHPPGAQTIARVCGQCHVHELEIFEKSPMWPAYRKLGLHDCVVCHGTHDIHPPTKEMLGNKPGAVCTNCHSTDHFPKGFEVAGELRALIDKGDDAYANAQKLVQQAAAKGMEVTDAEYDLKDARQALIQSRGEIHAFNVDHLAGFIDKGVGLAKKAGAIGAAGLRDYRVRRLGLGAATLVLSALALAIFLKIRDVDRKRRQH